MTRAFVAVCQQCGTLTDGAADLEAAGDAAEAHDDLGCDVEVKRVETDGGKRRTVEACPECDSTRIHANPGGYSSPGARAQYGCDNCGAAFDMPRDRPAKRPEQTPSHPRVQRLADADPDDLRADGSGFAPGGGEGPDQVVHCPSCETDFDSLDAEEAHDCDSDDDPDRGAPALIADGGAPVTPDADVLVRTSRHNRRFHLPREDAPDTPQCRLTERYPDAEWRHTTPEQAGVEICAYCDPTHETDFAPDNQVAQRIRELVDERDDGEELVTDGGHLPESFAAFANRTECPACGDVVHAGRIEDGVCVGCQHRESEDPGLSAEVGRPVQPRDDRIFERQEAMSAQRHGSGGGGEA